MTHYNRFKRNIERVGVFEFENKDVIRNPLISKILDKIRLMKIAIDLNGVVRDIFTKTEQVYTKFYLDEFEENQVLQKFNQGN
jgi:hypothetical protein